MTPQLYTLFDCLLSAGYNRLICSWQDERHSFTQKISDVTFLVQLSFTCNHSVWRLNALNLTNAPHMKIVVWNYWMCHGTHGKQLGSAVLCEKLIPASPVSSFQNLQVIILLSLLGTVDTYFGTCVSCLQRPLKCHAFYAQSRCSTLCTLLLADVVPLYHHSSISSIFITDTLLKHVNKWHFISYIAL